MPRSRKSLGTPVAGSWSAARLWEADNTNSHASRFSRALRFSHFPRFKPNSLFSDPNTQRALGRPCVRLEMAGA